MEFRKENQHFVIRLEKGEKVVETLNNFVSEKSILGGFFQAIGAVSAAEIGYYDLERKSYLWKSFHEEMEVVSMMGSITETGIHAHVVLADKTFHTYGGHLKEATVAATLEVFLTEMKKIRRKEHPEVGLKLMEL
ncbi:MAG: PPC domain-containing DNA-binding protein [Candidatus Micrarchaeota archaeon]